MLRTFVLLLAALLTTAQENQPQARGTYRLDTVIEGERAVMNDSWTLSKLPDGRLEVAGQMGMIEADGDVTPLLPYTIELDDRLRLVRFHVAGPRGTMEYRLGDTQFEYFETADGRKAEARTESVSGIYTLLTPSVSWSLPRLLIEAATHAEPVNVQFILPDDDGDPYEIFDGTVQFTGTEEITIRSTSIQADRFEVRSGGLNLDLWASDEGFVLAYQDVKSPEQRIELTGFERLGELLPSVSTLSK